MQTLTIIQPDDMHLHLRDGEALKAVLPFTARQMGRAVIMPNLKPPVASVADALAYRARIEAALPEGSTFEPLMTLYLTDNTTPDTVREAKAAGIVAFKLYPAGATTNSDSGVTDLFKLIPVLQTMAQEGILFLVHGEVTDPEIDIFDREAAVGGLGEMRVDAVEVGVQARDRRAQGELRRADVEHAIGRDFVHPCVRPPGSRCRLFSVFASCSSADGQPPASATSSRKASKRASSIASAASRNTSAAPSVRRWVCQETGSRKTNCPSRDRQ